MTAADWPVEHHRGSAAEFHERTIPDAPSTALWWFEVERTAVVLGSTQRPEVIDEAAAAAAGIEVAKRRSGGGAVLLEPGGAIWIDVILPAADRRWEHDVGRSFAWLGEAWVRVLRELGVEGAEVHEGPLQRRPWSDLVCFAGLGPGEVTVGGRKVVGISQRRTRAGARFQCALLQQWDPSLLLRVLALADDDRAEATEDLADTGLGIGPIDPAHVVQLLRTSVAATP
ncbi:MAG: lipoate--protein ligase family protein [Aquihabitans sp.]